MAEEILPGTLYVVSTPIGNLDDITLRAAKVLAGVTLIAAEDTRTTGILLRHLKIQKSLVSYYSQNEERRVPRIIERLRSGDSVALVSDAGTPGISDPAFKLIRAALDGGVRIIAVPGAAAFLPALVASGLPMDRFVFEGFLPVKKGRTAKLERLKDEPRTLVFYESPHRLVRTLDDLLKHLGDRRVAVGRELTKKFEEFVRGDLSEVREIFAARTVRGEFVLVVEGRRRQGSRESREGEEEI